MALLKKLFSSGAKELVDSVGNAIDKIHTSAEEKELVKSEIEKHIFNYEEKIQQEVTKRWQSDNLSDNFLSKNIRPMSLIFLTIVFTIISFADGNIGQFTLNEEYRPIYQSLLLLTFGAYFGGRSYEKIKRK
jgi:hypothetical protein